MFVRLRQFVEHVAAFAYSSPEITNDTFIRFVRRSSFSPGIAYSIAVAPVITPSLVPLFESLYGKRFWNNDSSIVAGDPYALAVPIIYPEQRFALHILGMNLMSSPPRRKAILESNRTRAWAISPPVQLVDVDQWFATISMLLNDLFTETLDHTRGVPTRTEAALRVVYPPNQQIFVYGPTDPADLVARDRYVLPFHAGSEAPWTTECTPSWSYRARFRTMWPWVLFGVVLASFLLMSELARRGLQRVIALQQTLHQLRAQERLLGTLQEYSQAIPDAMVLLDSGGCIMGVNDATMQITGYSMADVSFPRHCFLLFIDVDIADSLVHCVRDILFLAVVAQHAVASATASI
ncbi:hypothetical protein H9P43_002652 [Blastocladiella emersonii ATCC 22665]|nr:hypothetical protein H9P43_002652 [Blastocladiella emersonii ATCC 22665]